MEETKTETGRFNGYLDERDPFETKPYVIGQRKVRKYKKREEYEKYMDLCQGYVRWGVEQIPPIRKYEVPLDLKETNTPDSETSSSEDEISNVYIYRMGKRYTVRRS